MQQCDEGQKYSFLSEIADFQHLALTMLIFLLRVDIKEHLNKLAMMIDDKNLLYIILLVTLYVLRLINMNGLHLVS
jgi:hypothetical protein